MHTFRWSIAFLRRARKQSSSYLLSIVLVAMALVKIGHDHTRYQFAEKTLLDSNQPSAAYLSVLRQNPLPIDPNSDSPSGPIHGNFIALVATLSQPLSRGSVHITSNDPLAAPTIDPNYFSSEIDIEVYARHMLYLDTIAKSSPFSKLLKQPLIRRDPASHLTDIEAAKKCALARYLCGIWEEHAPCCRRKKGAS